MPAENAHGLVIRAVDFSETSRVVTFFTREFGKLGAMAKGARRLKSNFEVALDLLSVCRIGVIRKPSAELDLLTEAALEERFEGLRGDLAALYAGYFVAELLDGLTQRSDPHPRLYDQAVQSLGDLAAKAPRFPTLVRFCAMLVREIGVAPNLTECSVCGEAVALTRKTAVSVRSGGLVCQDCVATTPERRMVSGATVQALRRFADPADDVAWKRLALAPVTKTEIWLVVTDTLVWHLGRRPKMLPLLTFE